MEGEEIWVERVPVSAESLARDKTARFDTTVSSTGDTCDLRGAGAGLVVGVGLVVMATGTATPNSCLAACIPNAWRSAACFDARPL